MDLISVPLQQVEAVMISINTSNLELSIKKTGVDLDIHSKQLSCFRSRF